MKHLLPELPYALDALAPVMSADTLNYHYGKHLQTYLDNVNRMIEGTPFADMKLKDMITKAQGALYNNAAQAFNHIIFFKQLTPTPTTISPLLTQALVARFGSVDAFKSEFSNAAVTLFGFWLGMAGARCQQRAANCARAKCRQSHYPQHEASHVYRRVGTRLLP